MATFSKADLEAAKSEGYRNGLIAARDIIKKEDVVKGMKTIRTMIELEK